MEQKEAEDVTTAIITNMETIAGYNVTGVLINTFGDFTDESDFMGNVEKLEGNKAGLCGLLASVTGNALLLGAYITLETLQEKGFINSALIPDRHIHRKDLEDKTDDEKAAIMQATHRPAKETKKQ